MCGITGIFDTREPREISRAVLDRMNETQFHRGPDEGGLHLEPGVGLGHRRLSIIDLSTGQQPLFNEDRSVVVVFNGEIYNFQELVPELEALGHVFRTHSDTEVIVHAWEAWGEACVHRFRGMFAFALWDRNQQTFFVVRDRFGVKPLYYAFLDDGQFIFGSELKSLMAHPGMGRDIDPLAVEEYFAYGYVPEPRTIFRSANKLPPGYTLTLKRNGVRALPRQYWDMPFTPVQVGSEAEASEELVRRLQESIRLRMIADVPLGAFLSGGVDSSAVVAMMATQSTQPVNTCSIAFSDPEFNESEFAQQVADRYRTHHTVETVESDDFDLVATLAKVYDEPYADSSALPTYRVCELARKHVKVALSGDGGDEHFAGYRRYRWFRYEERLRSTLPLMLRRPLFGTLGKLYPKADWAPKVLRAKTTFEALARDTIEGYFHGVSLLSDAQRAQLFSPAMKRELQGYQAVEVMRRHAAAAPTDDPLSLVQYLDMKTYLVGDILTKVDRASMAVALEVRVPILDHRIVEFSWRLPARFKMRGGKGKWLLRQVLYRHVPKALVERPKSGFAIPLGQWLRGPLRAWAEELLSETRLGEGGLLNPVPIRARWAEHLEGTRNWQASLWTVLMLQAWRQPRGI